MLCRGIQEALCPIPCDLNEVRILLFPFPLAQDFSTQTQFFRRDEQRLLTPAPEPVGTQALPVHTAGRQEQPLIQLQHAPQWVSMAGRRIPKI